MRAAAVALAVALASAAGCDDDEPSAPSAPSSAHLGGDAVARVGSASISATTVRRIAEAQAVSLEVARERAIHDAVLAEEARARGVDASRLESPVLARLLVDELRREVRGPVTDEELERVTARHWLELRRPEGVRVVHAVVLTRRADGRALDEAERQRAQDVAAAFREAVSAAADLARAAPRRDGSEDPAAAEFERIVKGIDHRGLEVKVEVLDPFAADGRVLRASGGSLVREFVEPTAGLRDRGELTGPFATPFGVHVAMLLERTPPHEIPVEERRVLLADEVLDDRIRARREALLEASSGRVELAPNAAALLDLVRVQ